MSSRPSPRSGVVMDVNVGEKVTIDGGTVVVVIEQKSGQKARLRIVAPPAISIEGPKRILAQAR